MIGCCFCRGCSALLRSHPVMGSCISRPDQDPILGVRLRQACIEGDIEECEKMCRVIARGPGGLIDEPEPDSSMSEHAFFFDIKGQTALHLASTYGHEACVRLLLDRGASTTIDLYGRLPCHLAAENGHLDCLKHFLERRDKIDPNVRERVCGRTLLHLAAYSGYTELVRLLLSMPRLKVNKQEMTGSTALHFACHEGNPEVLADLLGHVDTDISLTEYVYGHTALHKACIGGCPDCVRLLLERSSVDVNQGDEEFGRSALHWAAQNTAPGASVCVELLLGSGLVGPLTSQNKTESMGNNKSMGSLGSTIPSSDHSMVSMASVSSGTAKSSKSAGNEEKSLCMAKGLGLGMAKGLEREKSVGVAKGAAVLMPTPNPAAAVPGGAGGSISAGGGGAGAGTSGATDPIATPPIATPLLPTEVQRRVCDIQKEDFYGRTALMYAAQAGGAASLRLLLDRDADVNRQDREGMTALLMAATNNRYDCLRILLEHPQVWFIHIPFAFASHRYCTGMPLMTQKITKITEPTTKISPNKPLRSARGTLRICRVRASSR